MQGIGRHQPESGNKPLFLEFGKAGSNRKSVPRISGGLLQFFSAVLAGFSIGKSFFFAVPAR